MSSWNYNVMYEVTFPRTLEFAVREVLKMRPNLVYTLRGHMGYSRDHTQDAIDKTVSVLLIESSF